MIDRNVVTGKQAVFGIVLRQRKGILINKSWCCHSFTSGFSMYLKIRILSTRRCEKHDAMPCSVARAPNACYEYENVFSRSLFHAGLCVRVCVLDGSERLRWSVRSDTGTAHRRRKKRRCPDRLCLRHGSTAADVFCCVQQ